MESHDIARNFIYHNDKKVAKTKETIILPNRYPLDSEPVVKKRLAAAGIRLGTLINQCYRPLFPLLKNESDNLS